MNPTDELLAAAFWQLLEEKPYKKITVRDIVDRCHVNRNTFYYHFDGIPGLMEHSFRIWNEAILRNAGETGDPLLALVPVADAMKQSRRAVMNLKDSAAWPEVLKYFEQTCWSLSAHYINNAAAGPAAAETSVFSLPLSEQDRIILIRFYKSALFGSLLDWINSGMTSDLSADLRRITLLLSARKRD